MGINPKEEHMLNIENLNRLKAWLEDGAPHVTLNMRHGVRVIRNMDGEPQCGTTCCIAGAAFAMSKGQMVEKGDITAWANELTDVYAGSEAEDLESYEIDWGDLQDAAADWLGIKDTGLRSGHIPLFSMYLCPSNCTPAQAAQAVQNVIDGKDAWDGVE